MTPLELVVALAIAVGIVGVVVPVVPGLLLVWAAVLLWASEVQAGYGWAVLALTTAVVAGAEVVKYVVPGRRMRAAGVPNRTLAAGAVLGVVGFFVLPVIGVFLGFVLGVFLAERVRVGAAAWASTKRALGAAGISVLIEVAAGLVVAVAWAAAVVAT